MSVFKYQACQVDQDSSLLLPLPSARLRKPTSCFQEFKRNENGSNNYVNSSENTRTGGRELKTYRTSRGRRSKDCDRSFDLRTREDCSDNIIGSRR